MKNILETEKIIFNNLNRLISPLCEFHWRGLFHPDKNYINNSGTYHSNDQGDATLHTGILLKALSWKYSKTKDEKTLEYIDKLLSYFELHIKHNKGMLGRNFVLSKFYNLFPSSEKSEIDSHIRYRHIEIENEIYYQRYDISIESVSHAISGIYWAYKYTKFSDRCKEIIKSIYIYYLKNKWKLIDDSNKEITYGNHSFKRNPLSKVNKIICENILFGKDKFSKLDYLILNYLPIYFRKKNRSLHYYKLFLIASQYLILNDLNKNIKPGIKKLQFNTRGDNNLYISCIYHKIMYSKNTFPMPQNWDIITGHPIGEKIVNYPAPLINRKGYCLWEAHPYKEYLYKSGNEITGNHDFLLLYWLNY